MKTKDRKQTEAQALGPRRNVLIHSGTAHAGSETKERDLHAKLRLPVLHDYID